MESIAEKISLLNFEEKYQPTVDKFYVTINLAPLEEMKQIKSFLDSKGIIIKRGSQAKVYYNGYDYLVNVVNAYEQNGDLAALQEDPTRINANGALERINYLKQNNLPYLDEKGKYLKCIFNKSEFNQLYGLNNAPQEVVAPVVEQAPSVSAFVESNEEQLFVQPLEPTPEIQPEVSAPIGMDAFETPQEPAPVESQPAVEVNDEIADILSKPQEKAVEDQHYLRYEKLIAVTKSALNEEEVPQYILDNIMKLITSGKEISDKEIIVRSINYGKKLNELLNEKIGEKLDDRLGQEEGYTGIDDVVLGR